MRAWPHIDFSVDQSVFLRTGEQAGIERLSVANMAIKLAPVTQVGVSNRSVED
jgi:hypothetical protein